MIELFAIVCIAFCLYLVMKQFNQEKRDDETSDELAPNDYENPPGYMPGEGGNY